MKKLFYLVIIIFIYCSCEPPRYTKHFTIPDNLRPVLKNGDTLCFKDSSTSLIDTFIVKASSSYPFYDESGYFESIVIQYNDKNKYSLNFYTSQSATGISIYSNKYSLTGSTINDVSNILKNMSINGVNYSEIYFSKRIDIPDTLPNKIYYTFQQGILRYDYHDGRHYDRISK